MSVGGRNGFASPTTARVYSHAISLSRSNPLSIRTLPTGRMDFPQFRIRDLPDCSSNDVRIRMRALHPGDDIQHP
jgi:hypothetical protein